ncbi:DUF1120 domain-containing protein [Pseudomonas sp. L1(2025)]|uniref:DUF1120 domain-containing protein n=1 Tax=Pseudomonas sp. L1(2025) TaxID=3449429 RepID=UPI003F68E8B4
MASPLTTLAVTVLLTATGQVLAASSVDLSVKGVITPSACTPSMPGDIDFGKIAARDLNTDKPTWLEPRRVTLNVICEAATLFALKPFDNRGGSAMIPNAFGLGVNQTEKLGAFMLSFGNPVAPIPSTVLIMNSEGYWWELAESDGIGPDNWVALGSRNSGDWAPHPLQDMSMDVTLRAAIAPANDLTLTQEVPLDGSATLEVMYL